MIQFDDHLHIFQMGWWKTTHQPTNQPVKNQLSHEWPTCHNRMAQHQGPWVNLEYTVKTVRISNTWSNTEFYMVAEH